VFSTKKVIKAATKCALKSECIAPTDSLLSNHRYDQSAFSLLMAMNDMNVTKTKSNIDIRCCSPNNVPEDETKFTEIQLMLRRTMFPKPYTKYLCKKN